MNYKEYHRDKTYKEEENLFRNIFEKRVKISQKYTNRKGKVLDIGASTGIMLDIFKENGWETWGVEPSKSAIIAKKKDHRIINDYFEKANLPKNYFDLVIMNHTLEHLDCPEKILQKIYQLLKSDGIILVDVPNAGGISSKILKEKWPYRLPEEHKSQFIEKSLSTMLKNAGFKLLHFESRSGIFEFSNPLKEILVSLINFKKRFFTNLLFIPYDILVTYLNAGDSMTIVGKKIK